MWRNFFRSELMNNFGTKSSIASRQGGDEFVLFLYGYKSDEELNKDIETLAQKGIIIGF